MTDYRLLLATTGDRAAMLEACLSSYEAHVPKAGIVVVAQEVGQAQRERLSAWRDSRPEARDVVFMDRRTGPHLAKMEALRLHPDCPAWVSIDDDMEAIPQTNYDALVHYAGSVGVGLVSGNWIRSEAGLANKIRAMRDALVPQNIVYTGGGMAFSRTVAKLLLGIPAVPWVSDNTAWSLFVYTAGFKNYRYLDSLAIHRVCSTGGRRGYLHENPMHPLPAEWVSTSIGKALYAHGVNNTVMPDDACITPEAHALHKSNRRAMGL